ncbi:MAG: hypothetical protein H6733_17680, partial [Alphaproteobacteria bacterium]|nr:hypothetical protein [Alphaproteobacteria bacterium]
VFRTDETTVIAVMPLLSTVTVLALVVFLRGLGAHRWSAWMAGAVLACWALPMRFGHTESPQVLENGFLWLGLAAATWHARRPSWGAALLTGTAVGLGTVMRPEGMALPLVVLPVLGLGVPRQVWRRADTAVAVGIAAALLAPQAVGLWLENVGGAKLAGALNADDVSLLTNGLQHYVGLTMPWTSPLLVLFVAAGLVTGPPRVSVRVALLVTALVLGTLVPSYAPGAPDGLAIARHQLRSLPWFAAMAGLGATAPFLRWSPRHLPVGMLVAGVGTIVTWPVAWRVHTVPSAYRVFVDALDDLPSDCELRSYPPPGDFGLPPPVEPPPAHDKRWTWRTLDDPPAPPGACVLYWRGPSCVSVSPSVLRDAERGGPQPVDACAAFEAAHTLAPLVETELPALGIVHEAYLTDPVRVGFYRVVAGPVVDGAVRPSDPPPASPTPAPPDPATP